MADRPDIRSRIRIPSFREEGLRDPLAGALESGISGFRTGQETGLALQSMRRRRRLAQLVNRVIGGQSTPQEQEEFARLRFQESGQLPESPLAREKQQAELEFIKAKTQALTGRPEQPSVPVMTETEAKKRGAVPKGTRILKEPKPFIPSPKEREDIAQDQSRIQGLNELKNTFENVKNSLGPMEGRVKFQLFDKAGGKGLSVNEQKYFAAESDLMNFMIKLITGAQVREQEEHRILRQVPTHSDTPTQWLSKFNQTRRNAERLLNQRVQNLQKFGSLTNILQSNIESIPEEDLNNVSTEDLLNAVGQ